MQARHYLPHESLKSQIALYTVIENNCDISESHISPPLGLCSLILCLKGKINFVINNASYLQHDYSAMGQSTEPLIGEISGNTFTVLVFIHPLAIYQLFGINMSTLTNSAIPLTQLVGHSACNTLIASLKSTNEHLKMTQILNQFFLCRTPAFRVADNLLRALSHIHVAKGNISIKTLEQDCFITQRSLERYFKNYIGLSPKDYIKIFRFKCLIYYLRNHPHTNWLNLCEANGFYDQSHLSRHFVRYLKMKPQELTWLQTNPFLYLFQN